MSLRDKLKDAKRVVIKVGTSTLLYGETGQINLNRIDLLVREIVDLSNQGKDVILEIEYIGAFNAKKAFNEAVLIFVTPPSVNEVYLRLKGRNTESEEVILKRIKRGQEEAAIIDKYDYVIVNDDIETAIEDIHNTIKCSKFSSVRNGEFVAKLKNEFDEFLKNY